MHFFKEYKSRTAKIGQEVEVYRNLKNGLLTIRCPYLNIVLGHCECVLLEDAEFKVSQKGRERVLKEKRKNVHAVVKGRLKTLLKYLDEAEEVSYNPYKYSSFVKLSDGSPVYYASLVQIDKSGVIKINK